MISPSGVPTLMMNSGIWSLSRLGRANPGNVRAGCRRYLRTLVQLTAREEDSFSTAAAFAILLAHGATPRLRRECEPERERELTTGNERHRTCVGERRGGFVERSGVSMQRIGGRETPGAGGKDEPEPPGGATNRYEPSLRVIADAISVPAANAPTVAPATGADVVKSRTTPEMRPPGESPKSRGATRCDDATETGVAPAYTSCCG